MIINGLEKINDKIALALSEAVGWRNFENKTFYDIYYSAKIAYYGRPFSIKVPANNPKDRKGMTYCTTEYFDREENGFPNEKRIDVELLCELLGIKIDSNKFEIPIGSYTGTIDLDKDTIKVGCQTIPLTETFNKIQEIMANK